MKREFASLSAQEALHVAIFIEERNAEIYREFAEMFAEFRDPESARRFVSDTIARGVIINWTLNAEKVVRLAPPLTIAADEIDFAIDAMQAALDETEN